ncbi:hypothetical protein C8Q70DRAFT_261282 [Cubamyces menziesii]|nr:hypothetical protein C8Q70DRAFT_261282 [Cubamyces menziesii]
MLPCRHAPLMEYRSLRVDDRLEVLRLRLRTLLDLVTGVRPGWSGAPNTPATADVRLQPDTKRCGRGRGDSGMLDAREKLACTLHKSRRRLLATPHIRGRGDQVLSGPSPPLGREHPMSRANDWRTGIFLAPRSSRLYVSKLWPGCDSGCLLCGVDERTQGLHRFVSYEHRPGRGILGRDDTEACAARGEKDDGDCKWSHDPSRLRQHFYLDGVNLTAVRMVCLRSAV